MNTNCPMIEPDRYARCIAASKRAHWEIEAEVIRGRSFGVRDKFLPDGLSLVQMRFGSLTASEKRLVSQIQGRTYANVFGLVERFINAKVLDLSRDYWLGDQVALEALVRFSDEEIKHQRLFRRIESLIGEVMPDGYVFSADADAIAGAVLSKSTWAVLALTLHIELFTQIHFRESIEPDEALSPLYKDVFLHHWREESQHAILDELEWRRHDACVDEAEREHSVDDFIALVDAVDGILQAQSAADAAYFFRVCGRVVPAVERAEIDASFLGAYRWQYILSGAGHPHFTTVLNALARPDQIGRISQALARLS